MLLRYISVIRTEVLPVQSFCELKLAYTTMDRATAPRIRAIDQRDTRDFVVNLVGATAKARVKSTVLVIVAGPYLGSTPHVFGHRLGQLLLSVTVRE
ncbi:hypothetical protein ACXR0O_02210 [Verrucomicrobiota bacterium sgz303538]